MPSLDYQIGGGLPLGYITQLYGPERLGKTLLALLAASYRIQQGDRVLYVNMESRFDPTWTKAFHVMPGENLFIAEPSSGSEALSNILTIIRNNTDLDFRLIILDTIALCYPDD